MQKHILNQLLKKKSLGIRSMAVLIDPDHQKIQNIDDIILEANACSIDYFFIGGSLILQDRMDEVLKLIREQSTIPSIIFPGSGFQINVQADALLFLSLVSGRNPEFLIGKHVEVAPKLHSSKIEVISTGYMLIDGGSSNTASYISQTLPIPHDKTEIAVATALACQFLGFHLLFMDAGSGAKRSVSLQQISKVSEVCDLPLIVGGGIKSGEQAYEMLKAGADVLVIGNAIEEKPKLIREISAAVKQINALDLRRV
jgi:phosphoglycerol geranylgeranyltransferase